MPTAAPQKLTLSAPVGSTAAYSLDRSTSYLHLDLLGTGRANSPGVLPVQVGNGEPYTTAYFFIDGDVTHFYSTPLGELGSAFPVYLPISGRTVGSHTVAVSNDTTPPDPGTSPDAIRTFTVDSSKDTGVIVDDPGAAPPMPTEPDRWVFQAYELAVDNSVDTWVLPLNPSRMRRAFGNTNVNTEPTTAPNGKIITWEGAATPPSWMFEGSVLTEAAFRELLKWGKTNQRFYVTDHNGHRYLVKGVSLDVKRVRDIQRPWHHTYRFEVVVLAGTGVF